MSKTTSTLKITSMSPSSKSVHHGSHRCLNVCWVEGSMCHVDGLTFVLIYNLCWVFAEAPPGHLERCWVSGIAHKQGIMAWHAWCVCAYWRTGVYSRLMTTLPTHYERVTNDSSIDDGGGGNSNSSNKNNNDPSKHVTSQCQNNNNSCPTDQCSLVWVLWYDMVVLFGIG